MRIIVGLGNPGEKFVTTRHNVGFMVLNELAKKLQTAWKLDKSLKAEISKTDNFILIKPQTFMNASGETVAKLPKYFNIPILDYLNNLYVVHDDLDIPLGEYKIQFDRSSAGHHGVESIIRELKSQAFWRVRIGIQSTTFNNQQLASGADFVLQKFNQDETKVLHSVIDTVVEKLYHVA